MKHFIILSLISTFVLITDNIKIALASPVKREVTKYTTRYDNIDIDNILSSKRLLLNYINCLLDKGPCTPEGKELKKYVPDALATECSKCSPTQKKLAGKVFSTVLLHHRNYWDQLTAKYDPDGTFQKKYETDLNGPDDYADYEET